MFGKETREKVARLESENQQLRRDLDKIASDFRHFERQAMDKVNKISLPVVDEDGEEVENNALGRRFGKQRKLVGVADALHELADFVGVKLQYRRSKDGYISLQEL